jgi:hypothetical protein
MGTICDESVPLELDISSNHALCFPTMAGWGNRHSGTGAASARAVVFAAGLGVLLLAGVGRTAQDLTARQLVKNIKAKSYSGDPVELRFEGVGLDEILLKFEEISGLKFKIVGPLNPRKLNFTFRGQAWDKALDTILSNNGLELRLEGDALVVDVFTPEKDTSVSAFLIGSFTAAVLFGGLAMERVLRKRRRRNRDRERKITLDPEAAEETVQRLNYLFQVEKIYRNSRLSLNALAERRLKNACPTRRRHPISWTSLSTPASAPRPPSIGFSRTAQG